MASVIPAPPATSSPSGVLFEDVAWVDYEAMLRIVGNRPIRVTYDRGVMEVFMPSFGHEDDAHLLGRMVEALAGLAGVALKSGRTTTHKRRDLDRGTEPDQCYWFGENARKMVGKRQLDLAVDPAPDLVVEVDLTRSSLERLPIFAALGVREIWRLSPQGLEFLHLDPGTTSYLPSPRSLRFPALPSEDVARFLDLGRNEEEIAWIRAFEAHARERLARAD